MQWCILFSFFISSIHSVISSTHSSFHHLTYLSIYLSIHLFIQPSFFHSSIFPLIHPSSPHPFIIYSVILSIHPVISSIHSSFRHIIYPSIHFFNHPPFYRFIHLSVQPSFSLIYKFILVLSVILSIHPSILTLFRPYLLEKLQLFKTKRTWGKLFALTMIWYRVIYI